MDEKIELKYFTAGEIKNWLFHNALNGLSEKIISKNRALSLVNHPDVTDDTIILSVIYVDDIIAGYTGMWSERMIKPSSAKAIFWGTTLYVDPGFEGRGFGYCLMMHIKEACDYRYFSTASSSTSIFIDKKLGSKIKYYNCTVLIFKVIIQIKNIKSFLNFTRYKYFNIIKQFQTKRIKNEINAESYNLEYINFIDDELYGFIDRYSTNDLFLRSKDTYNWILRYPFILSSPVIERQRCEYNFSYSAAYFQLYAVKVKLNIETIGFYILRKKDDELLLLYLYVIPKYEDKTFYSIIEHILKWEIRTFETFNSELKNFICEKNIHIKIKSKEISLTVPNYFPLDSNLKLQGGDGDMLT